MLLESKSRTGTGQTTEITILTNGPAKKQEEKQQPAAITAVIFQVLISLIKLNLNALIGQCSEKREI